jgi:hypothetical protein
MITGSRGVTGERQRTYGGRMRGRASLLAVGLVVLSGCTSGSGGDVTGAAPSSSRSSTAPSSPVPSSTPVAPTTNCEGSRAVDVTTAAELQRALDDATPGQVIRLADGRYEGNFTARTQATAAAPIQLCGSRSAVLDGGAIDGDYTLHLNEAAYWQLTGFTVTGGKKGVMVDAGVGNRIEGLMVTSMGDEAIHLRTNSTDNVVTGNSVQNTGLRKPKFGEGIYVGTAESNWCQISDCDPDRSDRNVIEGNTISGTTAEAVDIKEGTTGGVLRGNSFNGSAMVAADSWVDVKGNGWTIEGNTGTAAPQDGFQVHEVVDGWGQHNVFVGNVSNVDGSGYAINVAGPRALRVSTEVACDNSVQRAAQGLTNVDCARP